MIVGCLFDKKCYVCECYCFILCHLNSDNLYLHFWKYVWYIYNWSTAYKLNTPDKPSVNLFRITKGLSHRNCCRFTSLFIVPYSLTVLETFTTPPPKLFGKPNLDNVFYFSRIGATTLVLYVIKIVKFSPTLWI